MGGTIYIGDHLVLLNTKCLSSGPHDLGEFSPLNSMGANDAGSVVSLDPRCMVGRIIVVDHKKLSR